VRGLRYRASPYRRHGPRHRVDDSPSAGISAHPDELLFVPECPVWMAPALQGLI
jgi:hypothetical protein